MSQRSSRSSFLGKAMTYIAGSPQVSQVDSARPKSKSKSKSSKHHHPRHRNGRTDYNTTADHGDEYYRYKDIYKRAQSDSNTQFPIPVPVSYDSSPNYAGMNPTPIPRRRPRIVDVSPPDDFNFYMPEANSAFNPEAVSSPSPSAMQGNYGHDTAYTSAHFLNPHNIPSTSENTTTRTARMTTAYPTLPSVLATTAEPEQSVPETHPPAPHLGFMDEQGPEEIVVINDVDEDLRRNKFEQRERRRAREQEELSRGRTRHRSFSPSYRS